MQISVLSPCLLCVDPGLGWQFEQAHFYRLSNLLRKLKDYTNLKFQIYGGAPYDSYRMEEPKYYENLTYNNLLQTNVYSVIMKMLVNEFDNIYVDLSDTNLAELPHDYYMPDSDIRDPFLKYITYLSGKDSVLFLGERNLGVTRPLHIKTDTDYDLKASTLADIELTDVLITYMNDECDYNNIFPRKDFCLDYNAYALRRMAGMDWREKTAFLREIGRIVAQYNTYVKDERLTALNSNDGIIRDTYRKSSGKMYYLSVDVESGGFEVFDRGFDHMGQYNFCGIQTKPADRTHRICH